jgi:hypothetical protein
MFENMHALKYLSQISHSLQLLSAFVKLGSGIGFNKLREDICLLLGGVLFEDRFLVLQAPENGLMVAVLDILQSSTLEWIHRIIIFRKGSIYNRFQFMPEGFIHNAPVAFLRHFSFGGYFSLVSP